ncbi:helix-turn-helix transcriptional regulator [uncultured Megasphaera sp.]|uniref:helix-turn-helix domain-containing protein n=1 Tax=uncultured Megasphaera sp. TaxID=165188 RepID=UPI002624C75B|nr:helix-turn-helix transcriptional regulator [uncultured Megasphaera sp.]
MALKDNLKLLRENAGYEQAKEFAKAAGIPYSSYAVYERGSWPNEANLTKIASTLHVSIDKLLGYNATPIDEWEKCQTRLKQMGIAEIKEMDKLGDITFPVKNPDPDNPVNISSMFTTKEKLIDVVKIIDKKFIKEYQKQYRQLFYLYWVTQYNILPTKEDLRAKYFLMSKYQDEIIELLKTREQANEKDRKDINDKIKLLDKKRIELYEELRENPWKESIPVKFKERKNDDVHDDTTDNNK